MTLTYMLSLALIATLSIFIYVKLDNIIAVQVSSAERINLSGQQRALSQRTSLFAYDFIASGSKESQALAVEALNQMHTNHELLLTPHNNALASKEPSPLSAELQAMYFEPPIEVEAKMKAYAASLIQVIHRKTSDRPGYVDKFEFLDLSREPLLAAFNAVVKQNEIETTAQLQRLRLNFTLSTLAIMATLVFIAIFIKRPMVNRISRYAKTIEDAVKAQKQLLDKLASSQHEVNEKNRFLNAVMNNTGQGIVVFTNDLKLSACNDTFKQIMGLEDREYKEGMSLESFFEMNMSDEVIYKISVEEYVVQLYKRIENRLACDEFSHDRERQGGQIVSSAQRILEDGSVINTYKDVTVEREEERRMQDMALKDGLTGLVNRRAFDAHLDAEVLKFKEQKIPFLLAYIDLDNFKVLNDTHGHNAGDAVLKFVAETINGHIRNGDIAVRLGGDEFAIIFVGIANTVFAKERLELIISAIKNKKKLDSFEMNVGACVGLACCPDNAENAQDLMKLADEALYSAKRNGKGQVCLAG
jgi:diguanylate cyclase (GGDEF)-like protein